VLTDPPDPLAYVVRMFGFKHVLSSGTYLDSLRFRFHLAQRLGVDPSPVEANVMGDLRRRKYSCGPRREWPVSRLLTLCISRIATARTFNDASSKKSATPTSPSWRHWRKSAQNRHGGRAPRGGRVARWARAV